VQNVRYTVYPSKNPLIVRQLIGVLGALEKHINEWEDTDQTFLTRTLQKQHDKLGGIFHRFIEEQTRAIEDMKVTAKKRQGVLLMFKIFPVKCLDYLANSRALWSESKLNSKQTIWIQHWMSEIPSTRLTGP